MKTYHVIVRKLIWDDWNVSHIKRHDVYPEEVELSLKDKYVVFLKGHSGRLIILGRANKRLLAVIINEQDTAGVFYVVTARDMSKKERNFYRSQRENK